MSLNSIVPITSGSTVNKLIYIQGHSINEIDGNKMIVQAIIVSKKSGKRFLIPGIMILVQ